MEQVNVDKMRIVIDSKDIVRSIKVYYYKFIGVIEKPFTYFFGKPKIKIGDKLSYPYGGGICNGVYYSWESGIWWIKVGEYSVSHELESFYKNKDKK